MIEYLVCISPILSWRSDCRSARLPVLRRSCPQRPEQPSVIIAHRPALSSQVLPLIRAYSPSDKQPFVALLCDDAHAIRSLRLGEV